MIDNNNFYQDDIEDVYFDEECDAEVEDNISIEEEEHFMWWLRFGRK